MRFRRVLLVLTLGVLAVPALTQGAVSGSRKSETLVRVPNIVGKKLPLAEYLLKRAGLRAGDEDCDCTFGVVIKSHWYVCIQTPRAGRQVARGTRVATFSARSPADC